MIVNIEIYAIFSLLLKYDGCKILFFANQFVHVDDNNTDTTK